MQQNDVVPNQISEAIHIISSHWSDEERRAFSQLNESDLDALKLTLGLDIRNQFLLWSGNPKLIEACRKELEQHSELKPILWTIFYEPIWKDGIAKEEDQNDQLAEEEEIAFREVFSEMNAYLASELIIYLTWSSLQKNLHNLVQ